MAILTILSKNQQRLLESIAQNKNICDVFYLSGGTALAEFYLHHRYSDDLDFFSETEVDPQEIFVFLKSIQKKAGIKKIDAEQIFNRNLFFLHLLDGDIIKTEFTYFPFQRIEKKNRIGKLWIDSLLDIAVNKLFTIYQKPRARDYIDLYLIVSDQKLTIREFIKKAKIKFDWHVDPLQLAAQFLRVREVSDFPRMLKNIKPEKWQIFFVREAEKLKEDIVD